MDPLAPEPTEKICVLSFEVARIRLAGGPTERRSFWQTYREELALNLKTDYQNEHLRICKPMLMRVLPLFRQPIFYRGKKLVVEKTVGKFEEIPNP